MGELVFVAAGIAAFSLCWAVVSRPFNSRTHRETFRGGTELLVIDVSVLDKPRHPVRDLKASDFTVQIDGKTRPVVAFNAVDVAPPLSAPAGEASWVRDVAPDVVTNEKKPGRVFVILLDDYSMYAGMVDQAGIIQARKTAYAVVDAMGPDDRAAVVIPGAAIRHRTSRPIASCCGGDRKAPLFPERAPCRASLPRRKKSSTPASATVAPATFRRSVGLPRRCARCRNNARSCFISVRDQW